MTKVAGAVKAQDDAHRQVRIGWLAGITAYGLWGVLPVFWRELATIDPVELLAQRVVWAWFFFAAAALSWGSRGQLRAIAKDPKKRRRLALAAGLLACNWFVFVYAVLTDRLLDASLGYFINPLFSVALGRFVLGERLRRGQLAAVVLAAVGIAVAGFKTGGLPWISLALAGSFGGYGLMRKTVSVPALAGSAFESSLLLPLGLAYLLWLHASGDGSLGRFGLRTDVLLVATGVVTAAPLFAFVNAARRVTLTTLGFLQYLAPSLQFVLAAWFFAEPLSPVRLASFVCVWVALAIFVTDAVVHGRRRPRE